MAVRTIELRECDRCGGSDDVLGTEVVVDSWCVSADLCERCRKPLGSLMDDLEPKVGKRPKLSRAGRPTSTRRSMTMEEIEKMKRGK